MASKLCVDPHGIVHEIVGFQNSYTRCGWQRIWREQHRGVWHNLRWKLTKASHVTCIECIAWLGRDRPPGSTRTPYKYVR